MTEQIQSIDKIKQHARVTVEAGLPISTCPYQNGTSARKFWIAAYLMREIELHDEATQ